jgi:hypothetical protein
MKRLVGRIGVESSGEIINISFYNAPQGLEIVSTSFDDTTNEILVTLNQPILNSDLPNKVILANDNNRKINVIAISQTQMIIVVQDFEGVGQNNINWSYFDIDYIEEVEYNAFELSKLAHVQSILFGSGSEKLIALASSIGAPPPRPR